MNYLKRERETLERFLPSLDARLSQIPLAEIERPGNSGLAMLRELEGAALLVPLEHGGKGATPVDAIQIHRAVATRSPSLAVAMTMPFRDAVARSFSSARVTRLRTPSSDEPMALATSAKLICR